MKQNIKKTLKRIATVILKFVATVLVYGFVVALVWSSVIKPKQLSEKEFMKIVDVTEISDTVDFDIHKVEEIYENGETTYVYEVSCADTSWTLMYESATELIWVKDRTKVRGEFTAYELTMENGEKPLFSAIDMKTTSSYYEYVHIESLDFKSEGKYQTFEKWKKQAYPKAYDQYKEHQMDFWSVARMFIIFLYWLCVVIGGIVLLVWIFYEDL